jgi:hypothetical protein
MKKEALAIIISLVFISLFAVAGQTINEDVPQPYAGKITVAAPELLEGPNVSTVKTIQDGDVSPVTEKLINQGVIPAAVDKQAQEVAVPSN